MTTSATVLFAEDDDALRLATTQALELVGFAVRAFERADALLQIDETVTRSQNERLRAVKAERSADRVTQALAGVERACRDGSNVVAPVLEAVKAYATLGEICDVFREVWGAYREDGRF